MQKLRILTFNWHDPYLHTFAKTGHHIEVCDWMKRADGTTGWDVEKRPIPGNVTRIPDSVQALEKMRGGHVDLIVCHTLQDLTFVSSVELPTVFLSHNALHNDGLKSLGRMAGIRDEVASFLAERKGVFAAISRMKLESWSTEGFVVAPGIDLEDYQGYTGEESVALSVGNLFVERDHMLGYTILREIFDGIPHRIIGENPLLPKARKAPSWQALKEIYRRSRVYVNTTVEAFEDGYNLGMLEAMATGMPIVSLANATSPIEDGKNGYLSADPTVLRDRVGALLADGDLARQLGEGARRTASEVFSMEAFIARWDEVFEACLDRFHAGMSPTRVEERSKSNGDPNPSLELQEVKPSLSYDQSDLFPYTWEEVASFLNVTDRNQIQVPRLKMDVLKDRVLCDLYLLNKETGVPMVWQGLEAFPEQSGASRVVWPSYLEALEKEIRSLLERIISESLAEVRKNSKSRHGGTVHVNLGGASGFDFRVGEDRITPGDARSDIFVHHAKRYAFARPFCEGKTVVDLGSGTGYGTKMLAREAASVIALDLSPEALHYGKRAFGSPSIGRLACDVRGVGLRDRVFDVAVCFEVIEHIREHERFLDEVCRLLRSDGIFVVSTPNKNFYDQPYNENAYHVGMLDIEAFRELLSRHFGEVKLYGQKRPRPGESLYETFDFGEGGSGDDEVFVAVCGLPGKGERSTQSVDAPALRIDRPEEGGRMKVLVSHVSNPISVGRYYVDALRSAHDVITCGPVIDEAELAEWRQAEAEHALKAGGAGKDEKLNLVFRLAQPCDLPMPRGQVDIGKALEQLPKGWRPDLFIWVDSATGFLPVGLEGLDCPTACLVGDTHTGQMDWRMAYAKMFRDVFLMFNRQHIPEFEAAGCERVHWLPGACDPRVHGRVPANKAYDVGFVGQTHRQWHPDRVRLLERLVESGIDVRIESRILEEMALFYSRCRIAFNRSLNEDLNMRVFEALCSGSMLLTDRLPVESGLERLFQDRDHLVLYDDDSLEGLVSYYLENVEEREAIAAKGRESVLNGHTYAHRVDQIVEGVFEETSEEIAKCAKSNVEGEPSEARVSPVLGDPAADAGEVEGAIAELAEYTGEEASALAFKMADSGARMAAEWRTANPGSDAEIAAFYRQTDGYLYNLTQFNTSPLYVGWRGAIYNVCQQVSEAQQSLRVLEFGGGIGTTLIDLADLPGIQMTYADLPGKTFEYAEWRFRRRDLDVELVALTDEDGLPDGEFDIILCLDVLEHLVEPEQAVRRLVDRLRPGGLLVLTVTFYRNDEGPFHLNCDRYTNESFYTIVKGLGMAELSPYSPRVFQKGGREGAVSSVPDLDREARHRAFLETWQGPIRLNLGCGEDRRDGFINVDAHVPTADLQMDVFNLELGDVTVDEIFSSHMLEHLGKFEVPSALKEWHRVLKPEGVLRLNLPDLEWVTEQWLNTPEKARWGWRLDTLYGLQTHPGEFHKTGFTADRIEALLREAGFPRVKTSYVWSHGMKCLWVEAFRAQAVAESDQGYPLPSAYFKEQFPTDFSTIAPYRPEECEAVLGGENWEVGWVGFERLPNGGAEFAVVAGVQAAGREMLLQGLQIFWNEGKKQNRVLIFPEYLQGTDEASRQRLGNAVVRALETKLADPASQNGSLTIARFEPDGSVSLNGAEAQPGGPVDLPTSLLLAKRYLLAQRFADGAEVLHFDCKSGYGAKLTARVAERVEAVGGSVADIAFAERCYGDAKIAWQVADPTQSEPEFGAYDVVTWMDGTEVLKESEFESRLEQIRSGLKPSGVALLSVPNGMGNGGGVEAMKASVCSVFPETTVLGQRPWAPETEFPGQCIISSRVEPDDAATIFVCRNRVTHTIRDAGGPPRASVVIALYNGAAYTEACLETLKVTTEVRHELVLVDNGSTDGTGELLAGMEPEASVIRNGKNLGFAKANNLGARAAKGEFLLFLNNDTLPHSGWLEAMINEADSDPQVGVVGAKLLYPDDQRIQHAGIEMIDGTPDHVFRNAGAADPSVNEARELDMVTGACLLIRRDLFERLGGFDEGYVNGVEDVDLCLRARDLGYKVRYCPGAVLEHHEGKTEGRYEHVKPNLVRFAERWEGRFDRDGRFIPRETREVGAAPDAGVPASTSLEDEQEVLRGCWEGTQFVTHSLSLVNMSLTSELIRSDECELKLIPFEPATFGPEVDPKRYGPIAERMSADLTGSAQFHVRHRWPPDFNPPPEGHWVMMQPWEFGRIPLSWVKPIQDGVDEVWAYTHSVKRCYVESGIDPERVHVVPLGVDPDHFHPDVPPIPLETHKRFKFLFVGGTIYRKGIDVLLTAFWKAFRRSDDVCLVIKGMGDDSFYKGQTAGDTIRRLQADPNGPEIHYLTSELNGAEIAGLYTACDALVHPYRGEGFGLGVAEAMACGLPVIVTRGGACDDFCSEERAYFVPAFEKEVAFPEETAGPSWILEPDGEALSQTMRRMISEQEEAREKGRVASAFVREHLTWKKSSERALERLRAIQKNAVRRSETKLEIRSEGLGEDVPKSEGSANGNGQKPEVDLLLVRTEIGDPERMNASLRRFSGKAFRLLEVEGNEAGGPALLNAKLGDLRASYVVVLRDDVAVTRDWLTQLVTHMECDPKIALVAPRLPFGSKVQRVKAGYKSQKKEMQKFARRLYLRERGLRDDADCVDTACFLIRLEVLKALGGFDASFQTGVFLQDFCRRCRQKGNRTVIARDTFVDCPEETPSEKEGHEQQAVTLLETGDLHRAAGESDSAIACYRRALEAKEDYLEASLVLAAALLEEEQIGDATEVLQTLDARHPGSSRIKNYLARCLYKGGEIEEARGLFEEAIQLDPEFAEALSNLGVLLWESGALDKALEVLNRAAEIGPEDPNIIYNVAMVYAQLDEPKRSMDLLRSYLVSAPEDLHAQVYLAVLLLENKAEHEGLAALEYVLERDPDHAEAQKVVDQLKDIVSDEASDDTAGEVQ